MLSFFAVMPAFIIDRLLPTTQFARYGQKSFETTTLSVPEACRSAGRQHAQSGAAPDQLVDWRTETSNAAIHSRRVDSAAGRSVELSRYRRKRSVTQFHCALDRA